MRWLRRPWGRRLLRKVEVVGDDEEDDGEVDDVLNSEEDEDAPVSFAVGGGDDWD